MANFTDPAGEIAPVIAAGIVAAVVGVVIGAAGAWVNGAKTWDERLLWSIGGAIGGILAVIIWYSILLWLGVSAAAAIIAAVSGTIGGSLLGLFTPLMDKLEGGVAWILSWAIKLIKSPLLTIPGLLVAAGLAAAGKKLDFRRGALFVEAGAGSSALALGAIVYTRSGLFDAAGRVPDDLANHEAYHTRTVAALGEWGFYITYLLFGSLLAWATGGPWNGLNRRGQGNPFEKHAYTYYNGFAGGPDEREIPARVV